jgi:glycosyltransferase involved in cell wall biosynthesis
MSQPNGQRVLSGKRVAVVCGHFSPEIGYQEVDLASAFMRLGAQVRVVTSTRPSNNARAVVRGEYPPGMTRPDGYEVVRLTPKLTLGANVLGCKVLPAIREFAPDHVVLVGPGKLFGLELFSSRTAPWRRIAIVQDNSEDGRSRGGVAGSNWLRAVAHRLVKQPAYRRVVRNADRIVLNVPETREIVSPWLGPSEREMISQKALELRLGFDPEKFDFDLGQRERWRRRHAVDENELLLVTCTRATPAKRLEDVISAVSRLRAQGILVRYVLAGLLEDGYGRRLRDHAAAQPDPAAFLLMPMLEHDEMCTVFSACDLGYWPRAAITIQQAMGTGLPVVLHNKRNVSHLLTDRRNGWYVHPGQSVECVIGVAIGALNDVDIDERSMRRESTARFNHEYLSYDHIALEIIADREGR